MWSVGAGVVRHLCEADPCALHVFIACAPQEADAVILVYDLARMATHHRLTTDWLPAIQGIFIEQGREKPVILVGNKVRAAG
jgi:hypothetical protein